SDGEMSKIAFNAYAKERLNGLGALGPRGASKEGQSASFGAPLDLVEHADPGAPRPSMASRFAQWSRNDGPISYKGQAQVKRDIENMQAALAGSGAVEGFLTAASPGALSTVFGEGYYATYEEYVFAIADAMREEYKIIANAGLVLQLDSPDLAMERHMKFGPKTDEEFKGIVRLHVDALNRATQGLPREQLRVHVCWGNYPGPHTHDIPLQEILDILLTAQVGALSIEASNPRHEHEWRLFEQVKLPDEMILIPGVIDSCTPYVEHPELVAERITRLARLVGRDRVIAGSDCGFGTFAGAGILSQSIVWAKLQSLAEGAALASKELF
ncbi:MAG: epoxyalkane--coenzyme M transferase, partial [Chloroflexota bacterium]|nr:epoxyalkane--coenzyme M transferase [Chloroflexota bacterium]